VIDGLANRSQLFESPPVDWDDSVAVRHGNDLALEFLSLHDDVLSERSISNAKRFPYCTTRNMSKKSFTTFQPPEIISHAEPVDQQRIIQLIAAGFSEVSSHQGWSPV
jgi:hypothetical protein